MSGQKRVRHRQVPRLRSSMALIKRQAGRHAAWGLTGDWVRRIRYQVGGTISNAAACLACTCPRNKDDRPGFHFFGSKKMTSSMTKRAGPEPALRPGGKSLATCPKYNLTARSCLELCEIACRRNMTGWECLQGSTSILKQASIVGSFQDDRFS